MIINVECLLSTGNKEQGIVSPFVQTNLEFRFNEIPESDLEIILTRAENFIESGGVVEAPLTIAQIEPRSIYTFTQKIKLYNSTRVINEHLDFSGLSVKLDDTNSTELDNSIMSTR